MMHELEAVGPEKIAKEIASRLSDQDFVIIGFDGPTASGKTIMANRVGEIVQENFPNTTVQHFRLDWLLKERKERLEDLKRLESINKSLQLEGEDHMNLEILEHFLRKIRTVDIEGHHRDPRNKDAIRLKDLYNREDEGRLSGSVKFVFESKNVIICEGHYTSRPEISKFLDINVCLLGDPRELLRRKIERVKGYRSELETVKYFNRIDIPSFQYHLHRHGSSVDYFIDNTDYKQPCLSSLDLINVWSIPKESKEIRNRSDNNRTTLHEKVFKNASAKISLNLHEFNSLVGLASKVDNHVLERAGHSDDAFKSDLTDSIKNLVKEYNDKGKLSKEIKIVTDSAIYDKYSRILPHSLSLELGNGPNVVSLLIESREHELRVIYAWQGGVFCHDIRRSSNRLAYGIEIESEHVEACAFYKPQKEHNSTLRIYTPTDFTIPGFINESTKIKEVVYIGCEQRLKLVSELLVDLSSDNTDIAVILRFSKFRERDYHVKILERLGFEATGIGSYLIALKSRDRELKSGFRHLIRKFYRNEEELDKHKVAYDKFIDDELNEARCFVESLACFKWRDSFLQRSEALDGFSADKEIKRMLCSENRHLRKRAFELISDENTGIQLLAEDIARIYGGSSFSDNEKMMPMSSLSRMLPTILSEVYMWMEVRNDRSAVLGANVYDIDGRRSIDIGGLCRASLQKSKPIVFQCSMNALGAQTGEDATTYKGYLKLVDGIGSLSNSVIACFIDAYSTEHLLPFYGIGIDHIDSRGDSPKGRSSRFLMRAIDDENITHLVIDGSSLFKSQSRDLEDLKCAYEAVANYEVTLLSSHPGAFLRDLEFCAGELNYVENEDIALVPDKWEMKSFVEGLLRLLEAAGLGHYQLRNHLFIGNVGTTHHSGDQGEVDASITRSWLNTVLSSGFVSAVLHGTTGSEQSVLTSALEGCHKINIAGDLLNVLVSAMPNDVAMLNKPFSSKSKYEAYKLRDIQLRNIKQQCYSMARNKMENKAVELFNTINTPSFTERDIDYFHRSSYRFKEEVVDYLLAAIVKDQKESRPMYKRKNNPEYSPSMIEVPFEKGFKDYIAILANDGMKYCHIDVGDGKFISRCFSGVDKVRFVKSMYPEIKVHVHLMVADSMGASEGIDYIEEYKEADAIAIHARTFSNDTELEKAINSIRVRGLNAGLIMELGQASLSQTWNQINKYNLEWIVIMGVQIGYGGQVFNPECLKSISFIRRKALEENHQLLIEVDGGISLGNIKACIDRGADIVSGWSAIRSSNSDELREKFGKAKAAMLAK